MELSVEITPVQVFQVKIQGQLVGDFYAHSTADGKLTLKNDRGSEVVCIDNRNNLDPLSVVTSIDRFRVIKLSDDLIA